MRKRAFTLVELLVVVAIIALLLAILLPALNQAKAVARTVVCNSNLKSIGGGWAMFAADNDDRGPGRAQNTASQHPHTPVTWSDILNFATLGDPDEFVAWSGSNRPIQRFFNMNNGQGVGLDRGALGCPETGKWNFGYRRPLIANQNMVGGSSVDSELKQFIDSSEYGRLAPNPGLPNKTGYYLLGTQMSSVTNPSYTYMVWESGRSNDQDFYRSYIHPEDANSDHPYSYPDNPSVHRYYYHFRHPGVTGNFLFADGHVTTFGCKEQTMNTAERFAVRSISTN